MRRLPVLVVIALLGPAISSAASVDFNKWYRFEFTGVGVDATVNPAAAWPPDYYVPAGTPWVFSTLSNVTFTVTDAYQQGDIFAIKNYGAQIGTTSAVSASSHDCGEFPGPCLADAAMSHGSILLEPGTYSITIAPTASPDGGGSGYFLIDAPIPEPSMVFVLALAASGLFVWHRKRKSRPATPCGGCKD